MKQVSSWCAMARGLMAFTSVTFFAVALTFGQTKGLMQFQIPNEFSFGSKVLPAGTYTFATEGSWLVVKSATGDQLSLGVIAQLERAV